LGPSSRTEPRLAAAATSKEKGTFSKMSPLPPQDEIEDRNVIDLGCGYGRTLIPMLSFNPNIAVGVDLSLKMLLLFQGIMKDKKLNFENVFLIRRNIASLPFRDNSFDTAYSAAVMFHLDKKWVRQAVREIRRILKPGGVVYFFSSFSNLVSWNGIQGLLTGFVGRTVHYKFSITRMKYYTFNEVRNFFRDFHEVKIIPTGYQLLPKDVLTKPTPMFRNKIQMFNAEIAGKLKKLPYHSFATHFDVVARS